jgi:hypothetical protein
MITAWHLVWTAYGWWFPNDLRGSWSKEVWEPALRELGNVEERGRREVQPAAGELRNWLSIAQKGLRYRLISLNKGARRIVTDAITAQGQLHKYDILAIAVMPEHVHVVVGRHEHAYERMVAGLKAVSSRDLRKYFGLAAGFSRRLDFGH